MDERNLGNLGEGYFNKLCNGIGLICNDSQSHDAAGWDFIVSFPHHPNAEVLADNAPPLIECKVQVKATDGLSKKVQITLSNLMKLCTSHLPAFIFFAEFNGHEDPDDVYLVHVDEILIKKTLKRARQNGVSKNRKKLNNTKVLISYNESHKLITKNGRALKAAIENHIPNGMEKYITKKKPYSPKLWIW